MNRRGYPWGGWTPKELLVVLGAMIGAGAIGTALLQVWRFIT